jgi:predicted HTH transcriptional regulator
MPPDYLARLFQQRSQSRIIRFDETPVVMASLADMDESLWKTFIAKDSNEAIEVSLHKLAMVAQDDQKIWRPTIAGLLMGSRNARKYLPNAYIQAVAYQGTSVVPIRESVYQQDAQDITGPLNRQIFDACAFVRKNMQVAARKRLTGGREDMPQYDMRAIFEAITNAVAHRDYSMDGSKIRLRMFDDRLEIYSPGMLPNTMSTESIPVRQAARNEVLTSLLARCPMEIEELLPYRQKVMDRRGEGVPVILENSELLSGKRPKYQMPDKSELILTIYANNVES